MLREEATIRARMGIHTGQEEAPTSWAREGHLEGLETLLVGSTSHGAGVGDGEEGAVEHVSSQC